MDKLKQYIALTVVGCLAVLAAGWFLLVSPKRSEASEAQLAADAQVTANSALRTQIEVLKAQAKNLPKEQAKLAAVAAKLPSNRAMPALIRALTTAAEDAGVELVTLAPGATVVAAPAAAAAPVAPAAGAEGAAPAAPVAGAAPAAAAGQLGSIPVTLNVVGGYFQVQQFLANLEDLKRAIRFTAVNLAPGTNPIKPAATGTNVDDGRTLAATLTGQVFQVVGAPAAAAAPVAPVAAPAK
jgi:Tfp pilus assembly protein PilO